MSRVWMTVFVFGYVAIAVLYDKIRRRNAARIQGNFQFARQRQPYNPIAVWHFYSGFFLDFSTLYQQHQKFRETFQVLSSTPAIFTIASENLRVINSRVDDWGVQPFMLPSREHLCGRGFMTMDGDEWWCSRNFLRSSLARSNLPDPGVLSQEMDKLMENLPKDGSTVDLGPLLSVMYLNTSLDFVLGISLEKGHREAPSTTKEFVQNVWSAYSTMVDPTVMNYASKANYLQVCKKAHRFIDHHIEVAIGESKIAGRKSEGSRTLVQNLVSDSKDKTFIRSQVIQGMIALQGKTLFILRNVISLLARHNNYWQRVRQEVLGKGEEILKFETLQKNKLLRNVLLEALRLHPIPNIVRIALRDTLLPLGSGPNQDAPVFIPKGTLVIMSLFALHRDTGVFGKDVEAFRPERWDEIRPGQWEFMPFGGGMRTCLGRERCLVEAAFVLSKMALRFTTLENRDARELKDVVMLANYRNTNSLLVSFDV